MKQHISVDEFYELSKEQQRRLETWCFTHRYFTRLAVPGEPARFTDTKTSTNCVLNPIELSIGQMIEFLAQGDRSYYLPVCSFEGEIDPETCCDDLWKAVKEELEKPGSSS